MSDEEKTEEIEEGQKEREKEEETKEDQQKETGKEENDQEKEQSGEKEADAIEEKKESKREKAYNLELEKLKDALVKEKSKVEKPEIKPYTPYVWNSLHPYFSTDTVQYLITMPNEVRHSPVSRNTAIGLVDPEVSHRMDTDLQEVHASKAVSSPREKSEEEKQAEKVKKEGSTHLPKWPVVGLTRLPQADNNNLSYADVPKLREDIKQSFGQGSKDRVRKDYTRTSQDWTRMELGKLREINKVNRFHMKAACETYLGTSPGARKAVYSLSQSLKDQQE